MSYEEEKIIFNKYIRDNNMKHSEQRENILEIFLGIEKHVTVEELYKIVKEKLPAVGYATIYRTVKLFCGSGLCCELKLEDGRTRFEHLHGHEHHDHLICEKCGRFVEVVDNGIEKLQEKLARANGFVLKKHRLQLYGLCEKCRR
ncbi:MAG: hypothetical protein A2452_06365 [Candidatus Firestonebacteria bacterium RIFOXYC2_FULL_39_67]|nr:MAG: hypothetical protein A2452_06365 [Candidatus Firestonebacteria bacterium RIFOXYC2_FULL_39_67]